MNGFMVGKTRLTEFSIVDHLTSLPNMTRADAQILLDPVDKQNVPKATKLLQSLKKIEHAATDDLNAGQQVERQMVVFSSLIMGYFVRPFIDVRMSLSEQILSLLTYANLAFAMFRINKDSFMTALVYADSQAIVESIVITVARLQGIDPAILFYIIGDG
jgi:hypothetical protein